MATFTQIKAVRLTVDDPAGFLDLIEPVTYPAVPAHRTAYLIVGRYVYTEKTTGAVEADYLPASYRLSDDRISSWVDLGGEAYAVQQSYRGILTKLGNEMIVVRNQTGSESTQFTALKDLYDYYRGLIADEATVSGSSAGRWARSTAPEVAGGDV